MIGPTSPSMSLKQIFAAVLINLLSVPSHEMGHALVFLFQGCEIDFHITSVMPASGVQTAVSAAGGLFMNIVLALVFLVLYFINGNIYFFLALSANTFFVRILIYIISLLIGNVPADEVFIAQYFNTNEYIILLAGMSVMLALFVPALCRMKKTCGYRFTSSVAIYTFLAGIVSLFIMIFLDAKGI